MDIPNKRQDIIDKLDSLKKNLCIQEKIRHNFINGSNANGSTYFEGFGNIIEGLNCYNEKKKTNINGDLNEIGPFSASYNKFTEYTTEINGKQETVKGFLNDSRKSRFRI